MSRRPIQVTIPTPEAETHSLYSAVMALKELTEGLAGHRGTLSDIAVTWQDLIDLGLITKEQVPRGVGPVRRQ